MTIPDDLKILSLLYEYPHFMLLPLSALWIACGIPGKLIIYEQIL